METCAVHTIPDFTREVFLFSQEIFHRVEKVPKLAVDRYQFMSAAHSYRHFP